MTKAGTGHQKVVVGKVESSKGDELWVTRTDFRHRLR